MVLRSPNPCEIQIQTEPLFFAGLLYRWFLGWWNSPWPISFRKNWSTWGTSRWLTKKMWPISQLQSRTSRESWGSPAPNEFVVPTNKRGGAEATSTGRSASNQALFGCFPKNRGFSPKMDGLSWKTLLKWMIWGYHYFLETPISFRGHALVFAGVCTLSPSKSGSKFANIQVAFFLWRQAWPRSQVNMFISGHGYIFCDNSSWVFVGSKHRSIYLNHQMPCKKTSNKSVGFLGIPNNGTSYYLPIPFPYHSDKNFQRYGNGMGIVWEAYHKGVPLEVHGIGAPAYPPSKIMFNIPRHSWNIWNIGKKQQQEIRLRTIYMESESKVLQSYLLRLSPCLIDMFLEVWKIVISHLRRWRTGCSMRRHDLQQKKRGKL